MQGDEDVTPKPWSKNQKIGITSNHGDIVDFIVDSGGLVQLGGKL